MVRLEYGLAAALCLLSLLFLYRTHLFSGALHFTLDKIDPLIQASILEHWYGVMASRSRARYRKARYFGSMVTECSD